MKNEPIMAKALAGKIGATKRQVQFWTKHGIIRPASGGGGTGHHYRYPNSERPYAWLALMLADLGMRVGSIKVLVNKVRDEAAQKYFPPERYLVIFDDTDIFWAAPDRLVEDLELTVASIVIDAQFMMGIEERED